MREYSWKSVSFNADAQLVGEELEKLEFLGELTAEGVLQYAKENPDSETYKCFEWDDREASRKYRMYQANNILCSISVKISVDTEPVKKQRVYVNVKTSTDGERKFKNIKEVLKNNDEYQQVVEKARRAFLNCKEQYETIVEKEDLKDIIFAIYKEV